MRFLLLCTICLYSAWHTQAKEIYRSDLKSGDLIFEDLDCGPLCDAIEAVTPAYNGHHFSHMGIIERAKGKLFVIESIGAGVIRTSLDTFLLRSPHPCYIGVLKRKYLRLAKTTVQFAQTKIGIPYDDDFLYNNGKYYCSELVYDVFLIANGGKPFFRLLPMTYKVPGSEHFFTAWEQYFKKKNQAVPEGLPGCNPGSIAQSPKLRLYLLDPGNGSKQSMLPNAP
jgi:hypothetical protein